MKKLLLLLAVAVGAVGLSACEKNLSSLEGTRWIEGDVELTFSATEATYSNLLDNGRKRDRFTGKYTFDSSMVSIFENTTNDSGMPTVYEHKGTISGNTMSIRIMFGDIVYDLKFTRQ